MAGITRNTAMPACQRIIGIPVVVEYNPFPAGLMVTLAAFPSVPAGMNVIEQVAAYAFRRCTLVMLTGMTAVTCNMCMPAPQAVSCIIVVEILLPPSFLVMTVSAFAAQVTLVNIIITVTVIACSRSLTVFFPLFVAQGTLDTCMPAFQAVVRQVVIKGFPAELHDIRIAAKVIPVACATPRIARAAQSVKAALRLDVIRHFIMTVKAQRRLAFLAEWSMTFPAFLLVPGMPVDELSRHHQ